MIKIKDSVPEVYYKQSRDFQFLGRLFDVVLNSVKTNSDMIYDIPASDSAGSKMIDLLALTLGFKSKHNYSVKQLAALCSVFPLILRNKGNLHAIEIAGRAVLNSEGITDKFSCEVDSINPYNIKLFIPESLTDINLLKDLLVYILPAGMTCEIIRAIQVHQSSMTNISTSDYAKITHMTEHSQLYGATTVSNDDSQAEKQGYITTSMVVKPDNEE